MPAWLELLVRRLLAVVLVLLVVLRLVCQLLAVVLALLVVLLLACCHGKIRHLHQVESHSQFLCYCFSVAAVDAVCGEIF